MRRATKPADAPLQRAIGGACSDGPERAVNPNGTMTVAGVDEVGRGPLAGPVVVVAVVLPVGFRHEILTDSKKLSETSRERLYAELTALPGLRWSCIRIAPAEIDERNILRATHEGMRRAVLALQPQPDHALVDGLPVPLFPIPHTALVKGDSLSWSIAAASVLAKVTRDRLMCEADLLFPEYGFARHKGYGTQAHLEALRKHGPTPLHRRTFLPVAQAELFTTI